MKAHLQPAAIRMCARMFTSFNTVSNTRMADGAGSYRRASIWAWLTLAMKACSKRW